jgi:hypothetical protein
MPRKTELDYLEEIAAKAGTAQITGSVTVGSVELGATSLDALENVKVTFPSTQNVSVQNASIPVTGPLTDTQLRATAVAVSGTVTANTGLTPLTDTQLRATSVPVSLASVPSHPVTGPLTDTQLRATAVPVSGTVTANTGLTPLTDTQLRATAVPVSGTVTANTGLTQPLTDTQLRAASVPVSFASTASVVVTQPPSATARISVQIADGSGTGNYGTTGNALTVTDRGTTGPATVTNFTFTSSTAIAASNSARKLLTIFNEGAGLLYVLYGNGTATTSNYSVRINSGDYLEIDKYTGAVTGIFGSAGTARITEIT